MSLLATIALPTLAAGALVYTVRTGKRRERLIREHVFPRALRERVRMRYGHLSGADLDQVITALRDYFSICRRAGRKPVAMPSRVVDLAWHAFVDQPQDYVPFCRKVFGRTLQHLPAEAMSGAGAATTRLRRTWQIACAMAGIDARQPDRLPLLFAIDSLLKIPDGFRYVPDCRLTQGHDATEHCAAALGRGDGAAGSEVAGFGGGGYDGDSGGDGGGGDGGGGD